MYSVVPDHDAQLLRVTMTGLLSRQEVGEFWHDAALARADLKLPLTRIGILIHTPGNVVQSQEVLAEFLEQQRLMPIQPYIAVVSEGRLLQDQLRPLQQAGLSAVFDTVEQAERWLADKRDDRRAA